jgi:DNA polymerase phi
MINHRVTAERDLHAAASKPLKAMQTRVENEPNVASSIITGLLSGNGTIPFDRMTKTTTVEELLALADNEALVQCIDLFEKLIRNPVKGEEVENQKSVDANRHTLADLVLTTVKSQIKDQSALEGLSDPDSWLRKALNTLVILAYFVPQTGAPVDAVSLPPISDEGRKMFQSRLSSCLEHIFSKSDDASQWPVCVVDYIKSTSKSSGSYQLAVQVDDRVAKSIRNAHSTLSKIHKEEKAGSQALAAALRAFKILHSFTLIQVYSADADAASMLDELQICYTTLTSGSGEDSQPFALLVEVLLSFLSKPPALYKKLAEQVFPAFTAGIDEETLLSLLDILAKTESLAGQQEIFDQEDEAEEDGEEDESLEFDVNDVDSDVEMVEASEPESGSNEDESEDDDEADEEELQKFEAMLANTLKTTLLNGDADAAEDTSDGEDMDDDQMMALEPHLSKIFQQRSALSNTSKRKEKEMAREMMINFKNRVLDLLVIYVKREYANPLALKLVQPLLQLMRTTSSDQVATKATEVIHHYFNACSKAKTFPSIPQSGTEELFQILQDVHEEVKQGASKSIAKMHGYACSRASTFLAKVLVTSDMDHYGRIADVYAKTQKAWFENDKMPLQTTFFTEWVSWSNVTRGSDGNEKTSGKNKGKKGKKGKGGLNK